MQEKLKVYYDKTSEEVRNYFNISILLNACVKEEFYQVFIYVCCCLMLLSESLHYQSSDWASEDYNKYETKFLNFYKVKYQQIQAHKYVMHQKSVKDITSTLESIILLI